MVSKKNLLAVDCVDTINNNLILYCFYIVQQQTCVFSIVLCPVCCEIEGCTQFLFCFTVLNMLVCCSVRYLYSVVLLYSSCQLLFLTVIVCFCTSQFTCIFFAVQYKPYLLLHFTLHFGCSTGLFMLLLIKTVDVSFMYLFVILSH